MGIRKNDIVKVKVKDVTLEGNGVCKVSDTDPIVFVPNAIQDEVIEVKILKVLKRFAFGKIERILEPSSKRIESDCDVSSKCGGCTFRHMSYKSELEMKQSAVVGAMIKIAKLENFAVSPIIGSKKTTRYRNKAIFPIGKNRQGKAELGFYAQSSHRLVPCKDCMLHPEIFFEVCRLFLSWVDKFNVSVYDEKTGLGLLRNLYLRIGDDSGEIMVCIVVNGEKIPHEIELINLLVDRIPSVKSIMLNLNKVDTNVVLGKHFKLLFGKNYINDELCGLTFEISPKSFYQVNHSQTKVLYDIVKKFAGLSKNETLLDLYCGIGTIGLSMASDCEKVIGVEVVPDAIKDAMRVAKKNKITNVTFFCDDVVNFIDKMNDKIDVLVVDPPRKGCDQLVLNKIASIKIPKIVYVSCNPATLARDIELLCKSGYSVKKIQPVDMFPRTGHVETVVLFFYKKPDGHINVKVDFGEGEGKVPLDDIAERAEFYKSKERVT